MFLHVIEQPVATEPGIPVLQGNTPDTNRTNTKPQARVFPHRDRNHSHSRSHCNREPLRAPQLKAHSETYHGSNSPAAAMSTAMMVSE